MLNGLKDSFGKLIAAYEQEKAAKEKILSELNESREQVSACKMRINELERELDNLKLQSAFTGSSDNYDAKQKLDRMIREIDKCITLLEA